MSDERLFCRRCCTCGFPWLLMMAAVVVLWGGSHEPAAAAPPLVVETEARSPAEQRAMFRLPPGFEIQLVVSEPDIGQPMNLNFDAAGRLWISSSVEYPYPARQDGVQPRDLRADHISDHAPRDWITVVDGIGADGRPAKLHRFAEGLNIPIGLVPTADGAISYSIPHVRQLRDADGDLRADEAAPLYGPFGNVDTHGMVNGLRRWIDGWIYACHGFRNTSRFPDGQGGTLTLQSGNTLRFREDGSRVEQFTWGQVNPFGLTFDPWGNAYTADCHSRPLTCLIRGGYYQSFGKPHDGLGFAPDMIDHSHGSTGICGPVWYSAEHFPPEYREQIYLCNPVTGRVHRDGIDWRGSSPWVVAPEARPGQDAPDAPGDFISCEDGWFRPVDVTVGPDGALYVADFYNCIIGHYEVPLDHPLRDRTRGRVWRIVYRGESGDSPSVTRNDVPVPPDLTRLSQAELFAQLADGNLVIRTLATNLLLDRFPKEEIAAGAMTRLGLSPQASPAAASDVQRAHLLWLLQRTAGLNEAAFDQLLDDDSPLVRVHALRAIGEQPDWTDAVRRRIAAATADEHPLVQRVAVETLSFRPHPSHLAMAPLLATFPECLSNHTRDTHLTHTVRIALRNHLNAGVPVETLQARIKRHPAEWFSIGLGAANDRGAAVLLAAMHPNLTADQRRQGLTQIARYGTDGQLSALLARVQPSNREDVRQQLDDLRAIEAGLRQHGSRSMTALESLGRDVANQLLAVPPVNSLDWTPQAFGTNPPSTNTFGVQVRPSADGDSAAEFFSSLSGGGGERAVGVLRSEPFVLPKTLSFFIAGHNGPPSQPLKQSSFMRLHDATTGRVLKEVTPPRNDTAQRVEWDLAAEQGRTGYLEIQDGDNAGSYAWLAVGRFTPEALNPRPFLPAAEACRLVASLLLTDFEPELVRRIGDDSIARSVRRSAAEAWVALKPDARRAGLLTAVTSNGVSDVLAAECLSALVDETAISPTLKRALQSTAGPVQQQLALVLAGDAAGAEQLLTLIREGAASARLLQQRPVLDRLEAVRLPRLAERIAELTEGLPSADDTLQKLVTQRRELILSPGLSANAEQGKAAFTQHCAACHQIGGAGEKIGPQLDGVGIRGVDRLLEDILDPSRNVDAAFRSTILVLDSGQVVTGLIRREEGATLVLADAKGKEFSVPLAEVETRKESTLSLMPSNLGETLRPEELAQLVHFLLTGAPQSAPSP